jgi:hypothetical protein
MTKLHANLFAGGGAATSLEQFASTAFSLVGVESFQERESSNYISGHYFTGKSSKHVFKIMLSDGTISEQLPFWLRMSDADGTNSISDDEINLVAQRLIEHGYRVALVSNIGLENEVRVDYPPS